MDIDTALNPAAPAQPRLTHLPVATCIAGSAFVLALIWFAGFVGAWVIAGLLVLLAIALARPDLATIAVVFVMYADLAPVAVRSHGVPKWAAVSFFLLLLIPATYYVNVRRERLRMDAVLGLMCAYLGVQLLSVMFARNVPDAITVIISFVTEGIAVYVLILNTVRTPAILRRCIWALLVAGALLGTATLLQSRPGNEDRDFGGLALTHLTNQPGESLIDVNKDVAGPDKQTRTRALGPIGDPNFYAQIMVVLLPLGVLRFWAERRRSLRWVAAALVVPILGAIVLTFSRGAALAAMLFVVALFALRYVKWRFAVVPVVLGAAILTLNPDYAFRLSTLLTLRSNRQADASMLERKTIMLSGIHVFLDHPILGVGAGQIKVYLPEYSNYYGHSRLHRQMDAHDMYLEILADTGLAGFGIFAAMVVVLGRRLLALRRYWRDRDRSTADTITSLLLSVGVFLVAGIFLHMAYARYFWLLLALCGAAAFVYTPDCTSRPVLIAADDEKPRVVPVAG